MSCSRARAAMTEARLGRLPASGVEILRAHLGRCAVCAEEARFETLLASDLALLRGLPFPRVDAAARIEAKVRDLGPAPRSTVSAGQLAWAAMAAGFGLGAVLVAYGTSLTAAASSASGAAAAGRAFFRAGIWVARTSAAAVESLGAVARAGLETLASLLSATASLDPALRPFALAVAGSIFAASALVVGRDLLRRPPMPRKEPR